MFPHTHLLNIICRLQFSEVPSHSTYILPKVLGLQEKLFACRFCNQLLLVKESMCFGICTERGAR